QRLHQFGPDDLARQRWIIRASLATTAKGGGAVSFKLREPAGRASRDALLAAACAAGDRLGGPALPGGDGPPRTGGGIAGRGTRALGPVGIDLYHGLPGVALFLAYLGDVTGEARYTDLARAAVATLLRQAEGGRALGYSVGGFDGWGGVIYALAHL